MTFTGAIGLMALFLVDFADLYFLSLLGETQITSAIGFAGLVTFTSLSISIGIGIAAAALVAQNLGAGNQAAAKRFATNTLVIGIFALLLVAVSVLVFSRDILFALGARGATLDYGVLYLRTVSFGFPFFGASVCCSFILRALGDPRRAMYVTLVAAIGNAILDPLFIFGLDLSIQGAAFATICANVASFFVGFYGIRNFHRFFAPLSLADFFADFSTIWKIAFPATLTQLAPPFAIGYLTWASAPFGDEVVAGTAIINRLIPVAFGIVFSLSGAVGPIIGQNFGAKNHQRLFEILNKSMIFNAVYTVLVAAGLWLLRDHIPGWFLAQGDAARLVTLFCTWLSLSWLFAGAQYVAQACFNNLGKPHWSMVFNWGKATLGTIPFVIVGVNLWGFEGIMIGYSLGAVVFGTIATISVYAYVISLN
ncbi:MATE efflux family protein [hydrothermal vent metagenome]|uniref:MATE efflux family protein n=1 Tax=hydrothermal vent metagenome TaxID=652676 RepID=A0A3B0R283_9ZZZZ